MFREKCMEYARLEKEVTDILQKLKELATHQLEAFHANRHGSFMKLDKELENVLGEKERRVGALRQHAAEHGCWP